MLSALTVVVFIGFKTLKSNVAAMENVAQLKQTKLVMFFSAYLKALHNFRERKKRHIEVDFKKH